MRRTFLCLTAATLLLTQPAIAADYTVLEVDGSAIPKSEIDVIWKGLFPQEGAPNFETFDEKIKQNVLRGVVTEQLVFDKAKAEGFNNSEEVKLRLKVLERKAVVQAYLEKQSEKLVSDAELKKAYDTIIRENRDKREVKARHILVKSEAEANAIIKALNDGGSFETLAKEKSIDTASGNVGGDLGWFTEEKMVAPFAKTAFAMKEGDISEPVKTDFGWHIIRKEDSRKVKAPTFNELKPRLKKSMADEKLGDYIAGLVKKADITYKGKDGAKKPFTLIPDMSEKK